MDMDGTELHRWRYPFTDAFPDAGPRVTQRLGTQWWCGAHLFANGDLLAIFGGEGLIELDASSRLLWARRIRAHHDLVVLPDGNISVLTNRAGIVPRIHPRRPTLEDFVTRIGAGGEPCSDAEAMTS